MLAGPLCSIKGARALFALPARAFVLLHLVVLVSNIFTVVVWLHFRNRENSAKVRTDSKSLLDWLDTVYMD